MKYRTLEGWIVIGYLYLMMLEGQQKLTLKQISKGTGLSYYTVWGIVNRLQKEYSIKVLRYKDESSEDGKYCPHAIVSTKGYTRELSSMLWWFSEKFELKKAA